MDLEQLKLILETVENLGGSAQTLVIVYLCIQTFKVLVGYGILLTLVILTFKAIKDALSKYMGTGIIQARFGFSKGEFTQSEREQVMKIIELGFQKQKEQ